MSSLLMAERVSVCHVVVSYSDRVGEEKHFSPPTLPEYEASHVAAVNCSDSDFQCKVVTIV